MLSDRRRSLLLTILLPLVVSCDSRDRRIEDLCETLRLCTEYVDPEQCADTVMDALKDRRITASEMARCSECLGDHEGRFPNAGESLENEDCHDVLVERDCDKACEAVPIALRSRTGKRMRAEVCTAIGEDCGMALVTPCDLGSEYANLQLEAQLEVDARVADCRQCVVAPGRTPLEGVEPDVGACSSLLDACRERCRQVTKVSKLFETAADAVTVCRNDASCFPPASVCDARVAQAGAGGAPGAAGTGGGAEDGGEGGESGAGVSAASGAGGSPTRRTQTCMQGLFAWVNEKAGGMSGGGPTSGSGGEGAVSGAGGFGGVAVAASAGGQCSAKSAAGASGSGDASAGAGTPAAGVVGAAGSAGAGEAGVAGSRFPERPSRRAELTECALCVGTLSCDAIRTSCADACAQVRGAR